MCICTYCIYIYICNDHHRRGNTNSSKMIIRTTTTTTTTNDNNNIDIHTNINIDTKSSHDKATPRAGTL